MKKLIIVTMAVFSVLSMHAVDVDYLGLPSYDQATLPAYPEIDVPDQIVPSYYGSAVNHIVAHAKRVLEILQDQAWNNPDLPTDSTVLLNQLIKDVELLVFLLERSPEMRGWERDILEKQLAEKVNQLAYVTQYEA